MYRVGAVVHQHIVLKDAEFSLGGEGEAERVGRRGAAVLHHERRGQPFRVDLALCRRDTVLHHTEVLVDLVPSRHRFAVNGHNAIAGAHSRFCRGTAGHGRVHNRRQSQSNEGRLLLEHFEQIHTAVDIHRDRATIAQHMDDFRLAQIAQQLCVVEIRVVFVVGTHNQVTVAETHFLRRGVEGVTVLHGRHRRALFAPRQEDHGINKERH